MSMHKVPLTEIEEAGLLMHGLTIGKPSQLSDAFREGVAWGHKYPSEASAQHSADCPARLMPDGFPQGPLDEACTKVACPVCDTQPTSVEPEGRTVSAEQWKSLAKSATLAIEIDASIKERTKRLGLPCPTCGNEPASVGPVAWAEVERLTQQVQFLRSERPIAKEVEQLRVLLAEARDAVASELDNMRQMYGPNTKQAKQQYQADFLARIDDALAARKEGV